MFDNKVTAIQQSQILNMQMILHALELETNRKEEEANREKKKFYNKRIFLTNKKRKNNFDNFDSYFDINTEMEDELDRWLNEIIVKKKISNDLIIHENFTVTNPKNTFNSNLDRPKNKEISEYIGIPEGFNEFVSENLLDISPYKSRNDAGMEFRHAFVSKLNGYISLLYADNKDELLIFSNKGSLTRYFSEELQVYNGFSFVGTYEAYEVAKYFYEYLLLYLKQYYKKYKKLYEIESLAFLEYNDDNEIILKLK